jgi:hypothetical protein
MKTKIKLIQQYLNLDQQNQLFAKQKALNKSIYITQFLPVG